MKRQMAAALAAGVTAIGGLTMVLPPAFAAAAGCAVDYQITNQWPGGFQGDLKVTNLGDPISSWVLTFDFPNAGQKVEQGWNATWTQSGTRVTATSMSWNGSLGTGGSVAPGFTGTWTTANPVPQRFAVNGVTCTGGVAPTTAPPTTAPPTTPPAQGPSVALTSPTNGASFTAPATISLAANASAASGRSISKVDFYNGSTLLGTDTTAPYTYSWTNVAAGSYSLTARASDNTNASTTSGAVNVTVTSGGGGTGAAPVLRVSGNRIVTASGATYKLYGVNRSGGEFACIKNRDGIWNGPMDQASVTAMRSWKIRTVRVPLNEECWLGTTNNPVPEYKGAPYQAEVKRYVNLLIQNGITPIVEMHWNYGQYTGPSSGCSDTPAVCQKPMPDAQYAPAFWTSVANAFKGNDAVILDLFNEPYPERATGNATTGWRCWRDGGTCAGINYQVAGFQTLVNSVRATGATNIIMLGGLAYANDLSQFLAYLPADPLNNLAAFAHVYNFNTCANTSCWESQYAPVAAQMPLALTEIGENDCAHGFIDALMNWADSRGVGYLGWTWNNWDCSSGPSLISDYNGTATAFGQGLKTRLAAVSN